MTTILDITGAYFSCVSQFRRAGGCGGSGPAVAADYECVNSAGFELKNEQQCFIKVDRARSATTYLDLIKHVT